jgi:hypothetical protein
MITSGISTSLRKIMPLDRFAILREHRIGRNNVTMTNYRTMLLGIGAIYAAAGAAAVSTAARFAELALREGEFATTSWLDSLRTPQEPGQSGWEGAVMLLYDRQPEFLRMVAGLPRHSLVAFIGELDRIRGRRTVPHPDQGSAPAPRRNFQSPES